MGERSELTNTTRQCDVIAATWTCTSILGDGMQARRATPPSTFTSLYNPYTIDIRDDGNNNNRYRSIKFGNYFQHLDSLFFFFTKYYYRFDTDFCVAFRSISSHSIDIVRTSFSLLGEKTLLSLWKTSRRHFATTQRPLRAYL